MHCSRSLHGAAAAVACALLAAPAAFAATTTTAAGARGEDTPLNLDTPAKSIEPGGGGSVVRTIVGLAVVLGVIYGLSWVLKQAKGSRELRATGGALDPISTLQLTPGRALHLVRAGREVVLVGSAEHGVTPIRVYGEDEARALGLLDAGTDGGDQGGPPNPLHAAPGSPPKLRDVVKTLQRFTVRGPRR